MAFGFLQKTVEALWLLTILSAAENSEFAKFECHGGGSVCKNDKVEMICNSTKAFDDIELYLRKDKNNEQPLFRTAIAGEFALGNGMFLKLKNQEATLVIENTQFSHNGIYRWLLSGRGSSNKFTTINVSEPPTISKENGSLICQALLVEAGRRIIWSNVPTEFTSKQDATGLFNLSISQPWNDNFYNEPPCCKVVDENGSPKFCETCYTSAFTEESSGTPMAMEKNTHLSIKVLIAPILIVIVIVLVTLCSKIRQLLTNPASTTLSNRTVFCHL